MGMTAGARGETSSQGWSVDTAGLSRMRRVNHAGTGWSSMTMHGSSIGMVAHTVRGRMGHTGCEGTVWESETSVRCRVRHGAGGTRRVVMTAGGQGGSASQAWSLDLGGLSRMRRLNQAGTGSALITVHGSGLGVSVAYTVRGRAGHTGCEGTVWESETSVRCLVGHGAGGTRRLGMTVGERSGSTSQAWSVDLGSLRVMRNVNGTVNHAGTGSVLMTVHGSSMGLVSYTARGREGHTGCEGTVWISQTSVRCLVCHGAGRTRRVVMTVGARGGSVTQVWSVDTSGLSRMRRVNQAGTGSASMTVHGSGMGVVGYSARGRAGHTGCEGTAWESETSVRCHVGHGTGGTRRMAWGWWRTRSGGGKGTRDARGRCGSRRRRCGVLWATAQEEHGGWS